MTSPRRSPRRPEASPRNRRGVARGACSPGGCVAFLAAGGILAAALSAPAQPRSTASLVTLLAGSRSGDAYIGVSPGSGLPWLAELGYVEGRDVRFEYRSPLPGQEERLPQMARELLRLGPRVLVVEGMAAIRAARDATRTIPIVMVAGGDPVKAGFVKSLPRPGGNVTGVATLFHELTAKRLEILREVAPGVRRVGILWNPTIPDVADQWAQARAAAPALGLEARSIEVRRIEDVEPALDIGRRDGIGALLVTVDTVTWSAARRIMDLAVARRLPVMYASRLFVEGVGHHGLMAFAPNRIHVQRLAARYVDRILKGAKAGDLPVEQPTEFELVVNARTARAMGLTLPRSILGRADRVIE